MHAHRTDEAAARSSVRPTAVPRRGAVQGLGVTDALAVDIEPCQLPGCLAEIDELRHLGETALQDAWLRRSDRSGERGREHAGNDLHEEFDEQRYELQVLEAMRLQVLKPSGLSAPHQLCGPTRVVSRVVAAAMRSAVEHLHEVLVAEVPGADGRAEVTGALDAATAWVDVYVDVQAVEEFSFDPDFDDPRASR